jgi:DNA primase
LDILKGKNKKKKENLRFWRTYIQEEQVIKMPWFPEDWIDEVVSRNDIVDVVGEYVVLKPSGRGYFGLCPFHNEKTASFHVSPERQIYHCFGCGEGGNVVSFIMGLERMEFVEAMKHLAERAGVPLPDNTDTQDYQRQKDERQQLYEMNKECARYFHQKLFEDEGKAALAYLTSRGLDMRIIRSFGLGYAPDRWESAREYLKTKGYNDKQMLTAGITIENTEKGRIYDRFRNRVIFPIINPRGQVLGFGGRVMDDSLPKYLNSSDSPTFNKSFNLFGLNLAAKVRPLEYLIIVEGYMDVIALHQFGFSQAAASLGTSLTTEQAKLMRRYASDVYIAYDGDAAGQKAALRALDILKEAGCRVRVMQFPNNLDPDEILKQYGPEYFRKLMDRSLSLVDYQLARLREKYDLGTTEGKVDFATEAANVLAKVDNLIEQDAHIQELESLLGIKSRAIHDQISRIQAAGQEQNRLQRNINGNNRNTKDKTNPRILQSSYSKAEAHLVNLMAQGETTARKIISGLGDLALQDPLHMQAADIVRSLLERGRDVSEAQILSYVEDRDSVKKLVDIFRQEMEYDNIDTFISDCLDQVARNALEKHRQEIQNELTAMDREGIPDPETYKSLLKELQQLNRRLSTDKLERRELREKRRV